MYSHKIIQTYVILSERMMDYCLLPSQKTEKKKYFISRSKMEDEDFMSDGKTKDKKNAKYI